MPFLGEIRIFGGNFPPQGWAFCNGQLLAISTNSQLYGVLGTRYGGDGVSTFALPDLRGRTPLKAGQGVGLSNRAIGESSGIEAVALDVSQTPAHTHTARASTLNGGYDNPAGGVMARMPSAVPEFAASADVNLAAAAVASTGGGQPHNNMQPYLAVTYIIALQGTVPAP
jgi:microcystin-dependent protein